MTKTPRTDEQLKLEAFFDGIGIVETVEVEFAQQLETELADKDQQLAEARADADHWKGECNALQRMVHEARAEIERLKQLWSCNLDIIGGELNKQLVEARARIDILERAHDSTIEEQAALCSEGQSITELIAAKDKQLAEARAEIERLKTELRQNADSCAETNLEIDWCKACTSRKWCAAGQSLVEAAERGE